MTLSRKFLVMLLVVLALCISASFAAGKLVRSPAQVAADASPPPQSVITSPVVEGFVTEAIVVWGSVTLGAVFTVDAVAPQSTDAVVTGRPLRVGDKVRPGSVLAEVSYRPIIALPGRIPLIRDLSVGASGPDVAQLQEAVEALGWNIYDAPGTFGASTAAALENLYRSVGYTAPTQPGQAASSNAAADGENGGRPLAAVRT